MSSQTQNTTTFSSNNKNSSIETSTKQKYDTVSKTLSEKEKKTLKKQFVHIIPSYLISEKKQSNFFVPFNNQKKQIEEYHKLKAEIQTIEDKIKDLEVSKKAKLSKIDNLRCLLRRIANEDCFIRTPQTTCNYTHFSNRERCDKKVIQNCLPSKVQTVTSITTTTEVLEGEPEGAECGDGIGYRGSSKTTNSDSDPQGKLQTDFRSSFFQDALCYWHSNMLGRNDCFVGAPKKQ